MHSVRPLLITLGIIFLASGFAIGLAWWKFFRPRTTLRPTGWNGLNLAATIFQTAGYLFYLSFLILLPTPWRDSTVMAWLDHHSYPITYAIILIGLLSGALAICGRGAARLQVAISGFMLALMSFCMLCSYGLG